MDYRELMQYAPRDCRPTIISTPEQEAKKSVAKKYGKTVEELTESELAEADELSMMYRRATDDPLDAYRG